MAPTRFLINAEGILIKFNLMDSVWQGRQRGNSIIVSDWSSGRDVVFHFHYFVAYNCKPKQWLFNISYNLEGASQPAPASVETDCCCWLKSFNSILYKSQSDDCSGRGIGLKNDPAKFKHWRRVWAWFNDKVMISCKLFYLHMNHDNVEPGKMMNARRVLTAQFCSFIFENIN